MAVIDDDIEYMGTNRLPTFSRPFTGTQQPTGVVLHIEDKNEPSTVTITRPKSNIISLGRRPGSEPEQEKKYLEEGSATFRCPVVSRKHAQIIMEDDGKVFIRDLGSHHGTYLRRPDEPISTTLFPQMRRQLHSNDIVTLGKIVARDDALVPPVVARVEFLYTPLTPAKTPLKSLRLPPPHKLQSKQPRLSPSSSGRYGLQWLAASDDSSSSSSDHDSDLEEIPALQPTTPARKAESISASSLISRASQVIKKLIPPTETPDHILSPSPQPPSDICSPSSPSYNSMYEYMDDDLIFGRNEMQSPTPASTGEPVIIGGWPTADDHDEFLPGLMPVSHTSLTIPTWGQGLENGLKEVRAELLNLDHFNGDRLNDFERRLDESTSLCTTLVDQLETVAHLDMPDMQAQIEALQDEQKKASEKFEAHLSDVQALKDLVRDIKAEKEDHDAQMKDSLKRFREAATEIEALRTEAKNAMVVGSVSESLKRKRGEDEHEDVDTTPKRPRRFARMALQTTATVAVGAVATWSALAFS